MRKSLEAGAVAVAVAVAASALFFVRPQILSQDSMYTAKASNISVNYVLALYLYGVGADRLAKRVGKRKAWLIWGLGLTAMLVALKYVFGWEARW